MARKQKKQQKKAPRKPRRSSAEDIEEVVEDADAEEVETYSWTDANGTQRGLLVIFLFSVAVLSFLSFIDAAGDLGGWIDTGLGWLFGWGRYAIPVIFAGFGYVFLHPEEYQLRVLNYIGLTLFVLSALGFLHLFIDPTEMIARSGDGHGGGYLGLIFGYPLVTYAGIWASVVIFIALILASLLLLFRTSLRTLLEWMMHLGVFGTVGSRLYRWAHARIHGYRQATGEDDEYDEDFDEEYDDIEEEGAEDDGMTQEEVDAQVAAADTDPEDMEQLAFVPTEQPEKKRRRRKVDLPMNLLEAGNEKPTSGDIEASKEKIRSALDSFGIEVEMGEVSVGPMVSQYTLKPSEGVKLTQITTLHNDIALALAAHPIRIEAPIPGKSLVGIEVPNKATAVVTLRDILSAKEFKKRKDNLAIAIGKDVAGKPSVVSLQKMPHLLIAGATGSGKSVCMNGIIVSLLYQNSPDDLKFIMVDPKRVELSVYNGIPHLLTPVITDVEKTVNSLKWAVSEMDRRYEILARAGKRNIESYNASVSPEERMPYIVFLIDELADLMSVAASSVEGAIVRLAQMSRAVGIHLVLATQRPSVNVITGLIKANMPARIAFSVTSLVDSRTILDFAGAEKLLGRGDMLYIDAQNSKPRRFQGVFLGDEEIEAVVNHLKAQGEPEYNSDVTEKAASGAAGAFGGGDDEGDELLPQAKEVILKAQKASASLLQRRLRVGYARAARILDILEEQGFIGPSEGSKPREVLVSSEEDYIAHEDAQQFADASQDDAPGDEREEDGDDAVADADDDSEEYNSSDDDDGEYV